MWINYGKFLSTAWSLLVSKKLSITIIKKKRILDMQPRECIE